MASAFELFRLAELDQTEVIIRAAAGPGARVLEIGSGTGWQAKALSERGFDVTGVDLPPSSEISNHARARVWPITDYDGEHLPFRDASFDVVYSSNVLEHVTKLDALNAEMRRVLRPEGVAVHLLPNPQWRFLSLLSYYPGQAIDMLRVLRRKLTGAGSKPAEPQHDPDIAAPAQSPSPLSKVRARLLPPTHGAVGTPLTELARYSKRQWDRYFTSTGWTIVRYGNNGMLASGDYLLGRALSPMLRKAIGRAIGGIAHIYVLRQT
ncbi:MAG: class I SAM-dependent methyltransferase [Sphingomonadales bacterium]|nr:class I SAM-dependent methyltransferase [Sphingomonadales bacterium]